MTDSDSTSSHTAPRAIRSFGRLVAELLVVVFGILIAFQLESWRDGRLDRQAERETVQAILDDLASDSLELAAFLETVQTQSAATQRLSLHFAGRVPLSADSAMAHFFASTRTRIWAPAAPAYWGLRDSGRLDLISSPSVRRALVDFHDSWEPYLTELGLDLREITEEYRAALGRDLVSVPASDEPDAPFLFEYVRSFSEMPTHPDFRTRLGRLGGLGRFMSGRIELGIANNSEVQTMLRAHLNAIQ